jgi:hypothetical protein
MRLQPTATWGPKQERVALLIAAGRSIKAAAAGVAAFGFASSGV